MRSLWDWVDRDLSIDIRLCLDSRRWGARRGSRPWGRVKIGAVKRKVGPLRQVSRFQRGSTFQVLLISEANVDWKLSSVEIMGNLTKAGSVRSGKNLIGVGLTETDERNWRQVFFVFCFVLRFYLRDRTWEGAEREADFLPSGELDPRTLGSWSKSPRCPWKQLFQLLLCFSEMGCVIKGVLSLDAGYYSFCCG